MFSLDSINLICGCMVGVEYEELEDNSFLIVDLSFSLYLLNKSD
jgi:hypothetical protein